MLRRWLSEFIRNNKKKIEKIAKMFGILILVGIGLAMSIRNRNSRSEGTSKNTIYNPTKTIIAGENVETEDFKQEENLINTFVEFCNNNKIQEAYDLLTDECKKKMYPDLESFKKNYYSIIFDQKKNALYKAG